MTQPAYLDHVQPASGLTRDRKGSARYLPVEPHIRDLLPNGGLRRGTVIGVAAGTPGSMSLMLTTLIEASKAGSWVAIAGLPTLGYVAADELGLVLERTAVIPRLGHDPANVIAALIDGFDMIVISAAENLPPAARQQLAARARQRGTVIIPYGMAWDGADTTLAATGARWDGVGEGAGRHLTITSRGRGGSDRERRTQMWIPPHGPTWTAPLTAGAPPGEGRAAIGQLTKRATTRPIRSLTQAPQRTRDASSLAALQHALPPASAALRDDHDQSHHESSADEAILGCCSVTAPSPRSRSHKPQPSPAHPPGPTRPATRYG